MLQRYTASELQSPEHAHTLEEIIQLLTLSFTNDPFHLWLFSDHIHNHKAYISALPIYIRFLLRLSLQADASFLTIVDDTNNNHQDQPAQLLSVAITIPPRGNPVFDSTLCALRAGALTSFFRLGLRFTRRLVIEFVPAIQTLHSEIFPDPAHSHDYYCLLYLGTRPGFQGRGLGRKLLSELQESLRREDRRYPLYLEASNVDSKRLYERYRFTVKGTMVYGQCGDGEDVRVGLDKVVLGGRQFGMIWDPETQ